MCSRCNSISTAFVASSWAWHRQLTFECSDWSTVRPSRWVCPPSCVTFVRSHVLVWACHKVKGGTPCVNEAEYMCQIYLAAGPGGRQSGPLVGVAVWAMSCPTHTGNEVSHGACGVVQWH